MADFSLLLKESLTDGWDGEQRMSLEVGDLVGLLKNDLGDDLRFNLLTKKIEHLGRPIPVDRLPVLYCDLSTIGYKVGKQQAIDALYAVAYANRFHPVQEYLESLEANDEIEPVDLSKIGTNYFDLKDPLYDAMLKAQLIGAVKRVFEPGCSHRTVPVFVGTQDVGKSLSVKALAGDAWHKDTAQDNHKDFLMGIHGCWVHELAELDSITSKKEAGALKNDISSSSDYIRIPYLSAHDDFPRQSVFWGTSNRRDFLRDDTGASRFHVIELPHDGKTTFIDIDRLKRDRDAIWKAAVLAYRNGESNRLPHAQQTESNKRNLGYEADHPYEDFIADWIDRLEKDFPHIKEFTTEQALNLSGAIGQDVQCMGWGYAFKALERRDAVEVSRILRRLGYVQDEHPVRRNGKRRRYWRRADTGGTDAGEVSVPPQNAAVATGMGELTRDTDLFSEKESDLLNAPPAAAPVAVKSSVPRVPGVIGSSYDVADLDDWERIWPI